MKYLLKKYLLLFSIVCYAATINADILQEINCDGGNLPADWSTEGTVDVDTRGGYWFIDDGGGIISKEYPGSDISKVTFTFSSYGAGSAVKLKVFSFNGTSWNSGTESSSSSGDADQNVTETFSLSSNIKKVKFGKGSGTRDVRLKYVKIEGTPGGNPGPTNKPTVESITHSVTPTNNQAVKVFVSAFDNFATLEEVNVIYSDNDWSSSSTLSASLVDGKVFSAVLPAFSAGKTIKYTASAKNSLTNFGYATVTNTFSVRESDISGSNYTIRIMSANITDGDSQKYDITGIRIFQGLKPDIVGVQEFNYDAGLRSLVDTAFGSDFSYYCEEGGEQIPNGVISRWPLKAYGEWQDPDSSFNRDFAWATIDIPGPKDLHIVSVHLKHGESGTQNSQATEIKSKINSEFSENDYIVVTGDMNTTSRGASAIDTFKDSPTPLSDSQVPEDQNGNDDTNANRNKPYDWVLPNTALNNCHTATIIDGHTFADGLVYDSRLGWCPSPILSTDVNAHQHMAVVKDFLIPTGDGTTTNSAPVLNNLNSYTVSFNTPLTFSPTATDADGDVVTLTCSDTSHFSSVPASGTVTGTFSWTPLEADSGDHAIIFTANSGELYSRQMINISVVPEPGILWIIGLLGLWIIGKKC